MYIVIVTVAVYMHVSAKISLTNFHNSISFFIIYNDIIMMYMYYINMYSTYHGFLIFIHACTILGNTSILDLKMILKQKECTMTVLELVSSNQYSCEHLQFVIMKTGKRGSGIALELKCNLSELKTSEIFKKGDVDVRTLQALIKLEATIKPKSVEKAIRHITDDKLPVLQFALSVCDPKVESEGLTSLCTQALADKKAMFSHFLISEGAMPDSENVIKALNLNNPHEGLVSFLLSTPYGHVCLIMHAIHKSALTLAEKCLNGSTTIFPEVINLGDFLRSSKDLLCNQPDFLEKLLKIGVNPDGLHDSNRPIDAVLALPKDFQLKPRLMSTLIENGADLTKSTYPRTKGTTIFHIATEMAIDGGK